MLLQFPVNTLRFVFERTKDGYSLRKRSANPASILTDHAVQVEILIYDFVHESFHDSAADVSRICCHFDLVTLRVYKGVSDQNQIPEVG